ncbi:glycosyltransferase [Falsiroseomonas sp. CW058]|uniref:glycosyltransferase n=1 Tax=Falsiroseomonas sp. CW058 TaxID=3388664 RepID=UPI003D312AD8
MLSFPPATAESPDTLLASGDAAREARRWAEAERAYRDYLAHRPLHWQIHVQLGHAVKEGGDVEAALVHYRHAAQLAPDAADPQLQLGHALRLAGRGGEAAACMARALALAPADPLLRREAALFRHRLDPVPDGPALPLPAAPDGPPTALAFDVTDLLDYVKDARTPTGIQRVQMGLLGAILEAPGRPGVTLVAYDPSVWRWWQVEEAAFRRTLALVRAGAAEDDPQWRAAVAALVAADLRPDAPLAPGTTLASLGNAWGVEDYFRGLRLLRRQVALRYVAFLHDCVPLVMPEHCLELTSRLYSRWFAALSLAADGLLANSRATAADVARFAAPLGLGLPARVVPLAAEAPATGPAAAAAADRLGILRPGEPCVLFVATVESRKNHLMVFRAWLDLIRRHGPAAVPRLVCIGRPGWRSEAALDLLARAPDLRRRVTLVSGVSDLAMAGLTARCLFTVYNSFHEGWGLPVSESLAAGRLCVVPAHGGLLESGAPGAVFFPPGDLPALVAVLERLIADPAHRAALEARIDRAAACRSWPEAAAEVLAALSSPPPPVPRPTFPAGLRIPLATGATTATPALAWGEAVREGRGWWWAEAWGCWTQDGVATLHLPAAVPPGTPMRAVLDLRAPPGGLAFRLRARGAAAEPWRRLDLAGDAACTAVLQAPAGPYGLAVDFDSGDGVRLSGDEAKRVVGVGVVAVMACREDDLPARLSALEHAEG